MVAKLPLWAPSIYAKLHGVFCVYKPVHLSMSALVQTIQKNLQRSLNALPCYTYEWELEKKKLNAEVGNSVSTNRFELMEMPDNKDKLVEHRLVLGRRYENYDFRIKYIHGMNNMSSGVQVMFIGKGCEYREHFGYAKYLRVYHVKGRFGFATHDRTPRGNIIERTTYHHINRPKLDRVCTAFQATHQRKIFDFMGVDLSSQEAYEMATGGLVRPSEEDTPPLIYGVKLIDLNLPDFTIEVHAINETSEYLMELINHIGLQLRSTAVCTHIHRIRYGHFLLEHALLQKNWKYDGVLQNLKECRKLVTPDKLITSSNVKEMDVLSEMLESKVKKEDMESGSSRKRGTSTGVLLESGSDKVDC